MAKYTMELREILAHEPIFDFSYPIYDEHKRHEFESAFMRHFYFREIGFDTVDMFKHYLHDKFVLVFPYYNELMRTATIKYDIENPYKLTETYTRKADTLDKGASFMSAVSRGMDKTSTETTDARTGETLGQVRQNGQNEQSESVNTVSEGNETDKGTVSNEKEANINVSDKHHNVNKYTDTPQGLINLGDSKYLTNMTDDTYDATNETESTETGNQTSTGEKKTDATSETVRSATGKHSDESVSEGSERSEGRSETLGTVERDSTNDSNARTENIGKQTEEYILERKGNIGVNPATYEIDMHIKTQQTLQRIYQMFFDECEDLFMQVW